MQKQQYTWIDRVKDSSWVTMAWEWLQTLLGRICDFVLWVTMIFACYQLIPDAPQPPTALSVFMFVAQFVALDVGGLGLNQMARREGLPTWSYARIIAYCLIGITLITITYSGIEHAVPHLNPQITVWVEVILVIARSVMTVLYGQAIHSLKAIEQERQTRVAELEQALSVKSAELDTLTARFNTELNTLTAQLDTKNAELDTLHVKVNTLTAQLDTLSQENQTLSVKLNGKETQLAEMRDNRESSLKEHQESTQQMVSTIKAQLTDADKTIETLRTQLLSEQETLHTEKQKALTLTAKLDTLTARFNTELNTLTAQLDTKNAELDTLHVKVNTLTAQLDTKNAKLDTGRSDTRPSKIVRLDQAQDNTYESRIRALLTSEPSLSGREIARRVGCSIPTACNWKRAIEEQVS